MVDQVCDNLTVNKNSTLMGNVGIGIPNPKARLHLVNSGDQWSSFNFGANLIVQGNGRHPSIGIFDYAGNNPWSIANKEGICFSQMPVLGDVTKEPDTRLKIDNNGNVGIGTNNPQAQLDLKGNCLLGGGNLGAGVSLNHLQNSGRLLIGWNRTGGGGETDFIANRDGGNSGGFKFYDYSNSGELKDLVTIHGNGNVGIGTANPSLSAKLDVQGGDIHIEGGRIFYSNGRMHIFGEEILYLLNKDGVVVGKEWGGSGNLRVDGNIDVKGDVILTNADCAEDFDIIGSESIEPGTVMVIDNEGALRASEKAYDKRVAGVISGAGDLRPGITLDRQKERTNRLPLALTGKVYCKVDAEYDSIEVGDLLTSSSTPGHAMKADDPMKAFGAVIGKALKSLKVGQDLIPILVALQ